MTMPEPRPVLGGDRIEGPVVVPVFTDAHDTSFPRYLPDRCPSCGADGNAVAYDLPPAETTERHGFCTRCRAHWREWYRVQRVAVITATPEPTPEAPATTGDQALGRVATVFERLAAEASDRVPFLSDEAALRRREEQASLLGRIAQALRQEDGRVPDPPCPAGPSCYMLDT